MTDLNALPPAEDAPLEEAILELSKARKSLQVMTDQRLPKELLEELKRVLGLPGLIQEFTLRVKKHSIVEVECRYYPFVEPESSSPAE